MFDISKTTAWALRQLNPEFAHEIAISAISHGFAGKGKPDHSALKVEAMGLSFPNPIGLAAGFDKNARAIQGLADLGFGMIETGTVTSRPQIGNPKPRLFRLVKDRAIINRMGFNSCGIDTFCQNLANLGRANKGNQPHVTNVPVGANLGINKMGAHPLIDYPALVGRTKAHADYITINLSSPNTPGLRDLQEADMLSRLLEAINQAHPDRPPLLVKLAPDLPDQAYMPIVQAAINGGANGLILTNTTLARPENLTSSHKKETGGLSGAPLAPRAREVLQIVAGLNQRKLCLISSGGIETGKDILERLQLGADLVQIYTSFIYEGPTVLTRLKQELLSAMSEASIRTLKDLPRRL